MNMTWLMGRPSAKTHPPSRFLPSAHRHCEDGGTEGAPVHGRALAQVGIRWCGKERFPALSAITTFPAWPTATKNERASAPVSYHAACGLTSSTGQPCPCRLSVVPVLKGEWLWSQVPGREAFFEDLQSSQCCEPVISPANLSQARSQPFTDLFHVRSGTLCDLL